MNRYKYLIWTGTAVLAALFIFLITLTNQALNTATTTNTVSFSGEGKVFAKPDIAAVSFSVVTEARTSKVAQDDNSNKSQKIVDFLKSQKIDEKDIKTTGYNIYPQYSYPRPVPMGAEVQSYPAPAPGSPVYYDSSPKITGYQVNQSLIAVGSGLIWGRGFGQSLQKYSRLPEPIGDSIYAVIGEEFGFVGSVAVLLLFAIFALQGMRIAIRSPDSFGRLLALGIVILIAAESFINMTSILGIFPIAGLPLVFVSHGGSSMLASLGAVGIVLNVSRYTK